jgi:hypothetical protein
LLSQAATRAQHEEEEEGRTDGAVAEVGVARLGHGVEVPVDDLVQVADHHLLRRREREKEGLS